MTKDTATKALSPIRSKVTRYAGENVQALGPSLVLL